MTSEKPKHAPFGQDLRGHTVGPLVIHKRVTAWLGQNDTIYRATTLCCGESVTISHKNIKRTAYNETKGKAKHCLVCAQRIRAAKYPEALAITMQEERAERTRQALAAQAKAERLRAKRAINDAKARDAHLKRMGHNVADHRPA